MSNETCILTTKDFATLEEMRNDHVGRESPLGPILKRKIESAAVMFRDDVPRNVAILDSRVTYRVNEHDPEMRVISHDQLTSPIGMFLPITTLRGLALLGLAEGQEFVFLNHDSIEERIMLHQVHYQPGTARREKEAVERAATPPPRRKPTLTVLQGTYNRDRIVPAASDGVDDPGPSAA